MEASLTIVMSCYNQAKYIRQAIDSVLMQETDFPFVLLITDDNSTEDESKSIIAEYASRHPEKIKALLNDRNGRYLANVLRAKALIRSEYFTLLDADDYWTDRHYLQSAVDYLNAHNDCTVYSRNVVCLKEDGTRTMFLPENPGQTDFDFNDYLKGRVLIPQTTGAVFRNVVYGQGIPKIVADAVGTIHERSFEGDADRFLMHLFKGRAHYDPTPSGVYRMLSSGIWCRLPAFERHLIQAQCYADYFSYFSCEKTFFACGAYRELRLALAAAVDEIQAGIVLSKASLAYLVSVAEFCSENCHALKAENLESIRPRKLKDRLCCYLYHRLHRRLTRKGLL